MKKQLSILALSSALLTGCEEKYQSPNDLPAGLGNQYKVQLTNTTQPEAVENNATLEGRITKVQPSSLSFRVSFGDDTRGANHEFNYVILKESNNSLHTLIYPSSKAIFERNAKITFRPLKHGAMDSKEFVKTFIDSTYTTDDNITIEAEGIIPKGGIKYQ